jgi:hypothetical protein
MRNRSWLFFVSGSFFVGILLFWQKMVVLCWNEDSRCCCFGDRPSNQRIINDKNQQQRQTKMKE